MNSLANEFGRLAQGCLATGIKGTGTIDFIHPCPLKTEPHRVRCTAGGDKLTYDGDSGSPAASLLETKLIVNSTISDAHNGSKFLCADLKDHFLASPMQDPEFMRIHYKYFPEAICKQYNLDQFVAPDGYIYIRIKKGMYGLKLAAILAPTRPAFGTTSRVPPNFVSASTILASNTLQLPMQTTFLTLSGNITKFQLIGLVLITVDYPSSGTTTKNMLTYLCLAISPQHWNDFNTPSHFAHNMHHTSGLNQPMVRNYN
jgi:hypothetical protein